MRKLIKCLSIIATILSILWFIYQPGFEPAITALVGLTGLLTVSVKKDVSALSHVKDTSDAIKRKRILFVDDDLLIIKELFYELEHAGYKVVPADNADRAIKEFNSQLFDLIILDIMMPPPKFVSKIIVNNGYETGVFLAHKIKKSINKQTPIIVLTGNPLNEVERELTKIGISGYLRKPIRCLDLKEEVDKALA